LLNALTRYSAFSFSTQAATAANDIFALMDKKSLIDSASSEGEKAKLTSVRGCLHSCTSFLDALCVGLFGALSRASLVSASPLRRQSTFRVGVRVASVAAVITLNSWPVSRD
jgi:hypothetical protein